MIGLQTKYMNNLINFNIELINKVIKLILPLENIYSNSIKDINDETIGRHIRHIIDFYLCFIIGINKNSFINYDRRQRNKKVENDISTAKKELDKILFFLKSNKHINRKLKVALNFSIAKKYYKSTYERELMHLADHTIHHGHIIQIILNSYFPDFRTDIYFYSPSTLDSIKCVK